MNSAFIYPLFKYDYLNHNIFKKDLYNTIYQFQLKNNSDNTNAFQIFQILLNQKDLESLYIIKSYLDPLSKKLNHLLQMSSV